jgi:hypothetical protein
MNQAKNRKISKSASRKEPLSLNIDQPFGEAKMVWPRSGRTQGWCVCRITAATDTVRAGRDRC